MRMFEALDETVNILNSNVSSSITVFDYEPGDGHPDFEAMPAIYVYLSDTDFEKSMGAEKGDQSHEPRFHIDIYVSEAATISQGTGDVVFSVKRAHIVARAVIHEVYYIIMDQTFRAQLEAVIGETDGHYFERIEKMGVSKFPETDKSVVGFRMSFKIGLEEKPDGLTGIPFDETVDGLVSSTN